MPKLQISILVNDVTEQDVENKKNAVCALVSTWLKTRVVIKSVKVEYETPIPVTP